MSKIFETEAIVLKRQPVFEADCLFTVFTREQGRLLCKAKGVLKPLSKLAGGLLPASYSKLRVTDGQIPVVTSAITLEVFPSIRESLEKTSYLWLALEVILKSTIESKPEPEVFSLLLDYLRKLEVAREFSDADAAVFVEAATDMLGYGSFTVRGNLKEAVRLFEHTFERKLNTPAGLYAT